VLAGSIAGAMAQTSDKTSPKGLAFYQLVSGKWAKITNDARLSMTTTQLNIAVLQCNSTKALNAATASSTTRISKTVSQKLSRILIYQNKQAGLNRLDFGTGQFLVLPNLKIGKISARKDGFEISNSKVKITITFGRLQQGNNSVPVMIEGKALYLKCP